MTPSRFTAVLVGALVSALITSAIFQIHGPMLVLLAVATAIGGLSGEPVQNAYRTHRQRKQVPPNV